MDEKEFINKMDSLKKPGFEYNPPNNMLKFAIVNSKKSAAIGVWFLVVPLYFLLMVLMKYYFNINLHVIDIFEDFISSLDRSPATKLITPLFFVGLPIIGILINLLSIMFFEYDKKQKQINISVKLKWINILILFASLGIVSIFILYLLAENLHH